MHQNGVANGILNTITNHTVSFLLFVQIIVVPVPQILLAGHNLPIRNPTVRPAIGPSSLHKGTNPSHSMAETPQSPALCLPRQPDSMRL